MSTSKTQNIFVYPTWGPVLPNSGAPWALNLGGNPVLDNMAPPWVPKCMFIKCTQTTLNCLVSVPRLDKHAAQMTQTSRSTSKCKAPVTKRPFQSQGR